jgi:hypothetical protein
MGKKQPQKRSFEDVFARAERFLAEEPAAAWAPKAVDADVLRTDAGNVAHPITWFVRIRYVDQNGVDIRMDPSETWVFVDDETGDVRLDSPAAS